MSRATLSELAHREQDGLEVTLLWDASLNQVSIEVVDQRNESILRAAVPGRLALNAFHTPTRTSSATKAVTGSRRRSRLWWPHDRDRPRLTADRPLA